MTVRTGFIFDVDGTLVDSVYQHVIAWRDALSSEHIDVPLWSVHRKIGMAGGLFVRQILREAGIAADPELIERLNAEHDRSYKSHTSRPKLLPGAKDLLDELRRSEIPWGIATSGGADAVKDDLDALQITKRDVVVTSDDVSGAKPGPEPFLVVAKKLKIDPVNSIVVGDSTWDMFAAARSKAVGIGLLTGGFSQNELERGGALRVFADPAELLKHLDEIIARG